MIRRPSTHKPPTRTCALIAVTWWAFAASSATTFGGDSRAGVSWGRTAFAKPKKGKSPAKKRGGKAPAKKRGAHTQPTGSTVPAEAPEPTPVVPPEADEVDAPQQPAPQRPKLDPTIPTAELLKRAWALYEALECEAVIPVAEEVLAREDVTIDMRLDAYLLQGSSLAIAGDPIEAEKPFRFLLRGRPDYDMPAETPPKILSVFRKVQVEEKAIITQMRELERARIVRELELESDTPAESSGGVPLVFDYRLRDPGRAVQSVSVHYRRAADEPFSSLALQIDDSGAWRGEIPGEWTANDSGFALEYYVLTQDAKGADLLRAGDPTRPLTIQMAPGTVADARPIYKSPWLWTAIGVALVGAGVGGWFLYDSMTALPQTDGLIHSRE